MYDRSGRSEPVAGYALPAAVSEHLDSVAAWEDAALARLSGDQRSIGSGDCWVGLMQGDDQFVFGRVATEEECRQREVACGAGRDEMLDADEAIRAAFARGYRLGIVYSADRPDGDFVSTHVANMLHAITSDEFALARAHEWSVARMRQAGVVRLAPNRRGLLIGAVAADVRASL